jgi:hypothetical protein
VWNQQKENVIDEIFASTIVFNGQSITRDTLKQEDWAVADELSILQQLGALPT